MYALCMHQFLSSWRVCSVHAVPYANAKNFEGTFSNFICTLCVCISSWPLCTVHTSVPDAYAQCMLFLTGMLRIFWRDLFKFHMYALCMHQFLTFKLSARISSWLVCSGYTSVPYSYAQRVNKGQSIRLRKPKCLINFKVPKTAKIFYLCWH
jgi:hypothetical protein